MKICVAGNAIVFISAVKLEDVKRLLKSNRDALILKDGEKRAIFNFEVADQYGRIAPRTFFFDSMTKDACGHATVTMMSTTDDPKQEIAELYAGKKDLVESLEFQIMNSIEKMDNDISAIKASIEVLGDECTCECCEGAQ